MIGYMLLQPGVDVPDSKAMRAYLGDSLPDFMIPSLFVALEHFPQTPNGKVDRNALPEPSEVASTSSAGFIPPRTPFEEELALLWANVLDAERIGATENFFELGGHSLSAVQVAFRIRRDFGIDLPLQTFFDKPTLGEMADELQQQLFASADAEELDTMLDALDGLSEAEIDELLAATEHAETNSPLEELAAQPASPYSQVTSSPA